MSNKLVCFDSSIFSNVFRDQPPTEPEKLIEYNDSHKLHQAITRAGYKIIIPSIVLSESACYLDEFERNRFYSAIPSGLIVCDFTESSSRFLAKILYDRYHDQAEALKTSVGKRKIKFDSMILAIAEENGCDGLYTLDNDFKKYKNTIPILGLHDRPPSYVGTTPFDELLAELQSE